VANNWSLNGSLVNGTSSIIICDDDLRLGSSGGSSGSRQSNRLGMVHAWWGTCGLEPPT